MCGRLDRRRLASASNTAAARRGFPECVQIPPFADKKPVFGVIKCSPIYDE